MKQIYTKDILIDLMKRYVSIHKYLPNSNDLIDKLPSRGIYIKHFGSWNNAITSAGLTPKNIIVGYVDHTCNQCTKIFKRYDSHTKHKRRKSNRYFCSSSCAATYNNTHKTTGYRRSKLELYIEQQLIKDYPQLCVVCNDKITIGSELDIYVPSLRLAFELNGIFHYEPIYSDAQFTRTQNNDKQKIVNCYNLGIELCIIDTSGLKYFKPANADKYYQIVKCIINKRIGGDTGT